ncbi:globin [Tessaracoccus antarcticus]|uniref:Globin n=1 Tax=Tessaracoccus antarcticus TaxID=2479848 RepID=A0A3M0GH29_9ACTN|nr:globin [Tessaracoccus antarcticus]RMB62032.1 globin [Tessaracoccus antarcticus]
MSEQTGTLYERVGGRETFAKLIRVFYEGVAEDPPLRALYPEENLAPAEERLLLFMEQYWGGPKTYSETRGHPRLRMRHAPFAVTPTQRDRWLHHMHAAIDAVDLDPSDEAELRDYVTRAAQFMVNADEESAGSTPMHLPLA